MNWRITFAVLLTLACSAQQQQPRPAGSNQINSVSGDGNTVVTTKGSQTPGACVTVDANGNHVSGGTSGCAFTNQANIFGAFTQTFVGPIDFGTWANAQELYLYHAASNRQGFGLGAGELRMFSADTAHISLGSISTADGVTWSEKLRVMGNSSGNVGIQIAAPTNALTVNGSIATIALATPAAPTVTPTGTSGATAYSYGIVAKQADGSYTVGGPVGSTATGNATLDGTNYNALSWSAVTNAASYDVYRTVGGATQGKIATSVATTAYNDQGGAASGSVPAVPTSGSVALGGWTSFANTVTVTGSGSMTATLITVTRAQFLKAGNICFVSISLSITTTGTAAGAITIGGLPVAPSGSNHPVWGFSGDASPSVMAWGTSSGSTFSVRRHDGSNFAIAATWNLSINGFYPC